MKLQDLGWNEEFKQSFETLSFENVTVGRVKTEQKNLYKVLTEQGELLAEISGKYRYAAISREDFPAVGDWVVIQRLENEDKAIILALLPRFSKFSRKVAGFQVEEQIVCANVNTVFIIQSLNHDLNPRRLERYLLMTWESGANPVIVLTKADLCEDVESKIHEINSVAFGVPVHAISVVEGTGFDEIKSYFQVGKTVALLGSSGAGKSTLTNYLLGAEKQKVQAIREGDDKGRHTTTYRELHLLPGGGLVLDTPGMRELQLWESEEGLSYSFQDIESLAENCKFRDCGHKKEPGCAVRKAIEDGSLSEDRLESYFKLQKELAYIERKNNKRAQIAEKEKWKKINISIRKK